MKTRCINAKNDDSLSNKDYIINHLEMNTNCLFADTALKKCRKNQSNRNISTKKPIVVLTRFFWKPFEHVLSETTH